MTTFPFFEYSLVPGAGSPGISMYCVNPADLAAASSALKNPCLGVGAGAA